MAGLVCLQGGAEFGSACERVDRLLLRRSHGAVVLVPLACREGREYAAAAANGTAWYRRLGAAEVRTIPDVRTDPSELDTALALVESAGLIVLPGGSPARLLDTLSGTGLAAALEAASARGAILCGASAGAMVLAELTFLPEQAPPRVVPGLGLVPGVCVLPHYRGGRSGWLATATLPPRVRALGIPECTGVLVEGERMGWLGPSAAVIVATDGPTQPLPPAA